jgi:cell division protein FtsI/penicillin-binding protein 2
VGTYKLHGTGCRFELESGEEVDFDWDPDGRPTFDRWRVRNYARSIGHDEVTADQLAEALASLCNEGVLSNAAGDGFHINDGLSEPPELAER